MKVVGAWDRPFEVGVCFSPTPPGEVPPSGALPGTAERDCWKGARKLIFGMRSHMFESCVGEDAYVR